ncbi:TetR/AcrR family transcriptional regulator [Paractinoplanes durhamensis]|uniref:TetR family transcriptional regulator n=1 Tax=Paractinoplanes durhamensis TaxID=113563 RepID=A0ABQ3YRI8_9ACTN|nr:TetR/AcrR family transcriptional regulator [Actinoplanes durhamensis]GIE00192.1 TetR family transcriptional regulator [Actinoplanes durhamensis]
MVTPGLREQKKQQVRDQISDAATQLFLARGFEAVSVTEIAEAAGVSRMTVFNYFPRKEEMFFDRGPEAQRILTEAIRGRAPGQDPVAALRDRFLALHDERHPLAGFADRFTEFWQVVVDSPALRAALREALERLEAMIAALLAEAGHPRAELTAALVLAAYRVGYVEAIRRIRAGEPAESFFAEQRARIARAFDAAAAAAATIDPPW